MYVKRTGNMTQSQVIPQPVQYGWTTWETKQNQQCK